MEISKKKKLEEEISHRLFKILNNYKEVQILAKILEKTANESCQMNDMSWLVFEKQVQSLLFIARQNWDNKIIKF
mgnify:CR=1 FL=1